jgi:DNA repair exonuclease SbcCD ATPase subunit
MVRQKEAMETELSNLRKAKSVGDAKEQELQEKLARYSVALKKSSAQAAKVPELLSKVSQLSEQLTHANRNIEKLTEQVNNARQLKESVDNKEAAVTRLTEQVSTLTKKSETLEAKLEGQTKVYTQKLEERTKLAKSYKARFIETLNRYVESKASMLGVQPSEITSRLNENYTLADVDAVCDQILDSAVSFSRLPFGGRTKTSARIAESVSKSAIAGTRNNPDYGYEIDDTLLELAGLKK